MDGWCRVGGGGLSGGVGVDACVVGGFVAGR